MARQSFVVNGEFFKTKGDLQNRVRRILWTYLEGQDLPIDDFEFMLDLLTNHPRADIKIGPGVARIFVKQNPVYKTRGFYAERVDGTQTDFSYLECISPASKRKKVFMALRVLIEPFTMEFKQRFFDAVGGAATCDFTGEEIHFIGSHVDHVPPNTFDVLANGFIDHYNINLAQVELKDELADNRIQNELADEWLATLWVQWHNERAKLRVISKRANLSLVKISS